MTEKQTIKKGESGGKTRDYLLFMLKQESISDALASLAIYHLSVYMPVCGAITHTDDIFDMAGIAKTVYTKLLEAGKKPETLADGTFSMFENYDGSQVKLKLSKVLEQAREDGGGAVKQSVIDMIGVIGQAIASEWHHHTMEWQEEEHLTDETHEGYKRAHAQWEKRGGMHLRHEDWEIERSRYVATTNCLVERVFGLRNWCDDKTNGNLRRDHLEGQIMCMYNHTIDFWLKQLYAVPLDQREAVGKKHLIVLRGLVREHEARVGNKRAQYERDGRIQKQKDDALLAVVAARRAKDKAEVERLQEVALASTWDELLKLDVAAMKEQVRARKKVHGAVGLKLSEASSRFSALRVLVKHLKLGISDDAIRTALQLNSVRAAPRRQRGAGHPRGGEAEVEQLLGAVTEDNGNRLYLIHWKGYDEDESTWEPYANLILKDQEGNPTISAALEQQLSAFDCVVDDELALLSERHEATQRALTCTLLPGARVLVDLDEGYSTGVVTSAQSNGSVGVLVDGAAQFKLFSRDDLFAIEHSPSFDSSQVLEPGTRVRVAYDDDDAPLTKRRWYYGVIVTIDDRHELVSVDFDNGEQLRDAPLFDVFFVAAAPQASKRQRRR